MMAGFHEPGPGSRAATCQEGLCPGGISEPFLSLKSLLEGDLTWCDRVPALTLGTTAHVGESRPSCIRAPHVCTTCPLERAQWGAGALRDTPHHHCLRY